MEQCGSRMHFAGSGDMCREDSSWMSEEVDDSSGCEFLLALDLVKQDAIMKPGDVQQAAA